MSSNLFLCSSPVPFLCPLFLPLYLFNLGGVSGTSAFILLMSSCRLSSPHSKGNEAAWQLSSLSLTLGPHRAGHRGAPLGPLRPAARAPCPSTGEAEVPVTIRMVQPQTSPSRQKKKYVAEAERMWPTFPFSMPYCCPKKTL